MKLFRSRRNNPDRDAKGLSDERKRKILQEWNAGPVGYASVYPEDPSEDPPSLEIPDGCEGLNAPLLSDEEGSSSSWWRVELLEWRVSHGELVAENAPLVDILYCGHDLERATRTVSAPRAGRLHVPSSMLGRCLEFGHLYSGDLLGYIDPKPAEALRRKALADQEAERKRQEEAEADERQRRREDEDRERRQLRERRVALSREKKTTARVLDRLRQELHALEAAKQADLVGRSLPVYIDVFSRRYEELTTDAIARDTEGRFTELLQELRALLHTQTDGIPLDHLEPIASNVNEVNTVEHALLPLLDMRDKAAAIARAEERDVRLRHWEEMLLQEMSKYYNAFVARQTELGPVS